MKRTVLTVLILLFHLVVFCQEWTEEQLEKANTAAGVDALATDEQYAIMYINLARLFPKDFVEIELADDADLNAVYPVYLGTLISELNNAIPAGALQYDETLQEYARCFAKESGDRGTVGHKRKKCRKGYDAECCSYGVQAGWDIALQWLIDDNIPGLGHRINCLSKRYTKIGLSIHAHKKYGVCAVADFGL